MKNFVRVLGKIRHHRVLIIAVLCCVLALTGAFFATQGVVYGESVFPETLTYGDELSYSAKAMFSKVSYEYRADGSTEWSEEFPDATGKYFVRAVSKGGFGRRVYGEEHAFSVGPRAVTVRVAQDTVMYGELPAVAGDALRDGDTVECTAFDFADSSKAQTEVAPAMDAVVIRDKDGVDVTANYALTVSTSEIAFSKRPVTLSVVPVTMQYSGEALASEVYEISSGSLAAGDTVITVFTHSQTEIGECLNDPSVRIVNKKGADVTEQYKLQKVAGTLTVQKRVVVITTKGQEFTYDGTAHQHAEYTIGSLANGHSEHMLETTSITDVGEKENLLSFDIRNEDGDSVMEEYYVVEFVKGKLKVLPRAVTVETASGSFVYDGTAHSADTPNVTQDGDGLVAGHTLTLHETASILNVGTVSNTAKAKIMCGDTDVTANYSITYVNGDLTVTKRPITVTANSRTRVYNAITLSASGVTVSDGTGEGLVSTHEIEATVSGAQTSVGTSKNVLESAVIKDAAGKDVSENYEITLVDGELKVTPRPLTVTSNSAQKVYDATPLTDSGFTTSKGTGEGLVESHEIAVEIIGTITDAGYVVNAISHAVITDDAGEDMSANYSIMYVGGILQVSKRPVTITTNSQSKVYDGTALTNTLYTVERADGDRGLLAEHEEELRIYGSALNVWDDFRNLFDAVIKDGANGDVTDNYEIEAIYGELKITPRPITLTSGFASKVYDGLALYCHDAPTVTTAQDEGLATGESLTASFTGSITNAGDAQNLFTVVICNAQSIPTTDNYTITYVYGSLTVTKRPITVLSGSDLKTYDGTPLTNSSYSISQTEGEQLAPNQTGTVSFTGSATNVWDDANNYFTIVIRDTVGEETTENYEITYVYGTLTINKRTLTVSSGSATQMYDGTALVKWEHEVSTTVGDGLLAGQNVWAKYTGSAINVWDDTNNYFTIVIRDAAENDATRNYDITYVYGSLTITKRPITVDSHSASKVYNGKALYCKEYGLISEYTLAQGDIARVTEFVQITDVASNVANVLKIDIFRGEEPVSDNYLISYTDNGTLTVTPRPVTIQPQNASKVYDGVELKTPTEIVENASVLALKELGFTWTVTQTSGGQLNVGSSASAITAGGIAFYLNGARVAESNFTITHETGTLTVTPRPITVTASSGSKVYDATPLEMPNATANAGTNRGLAEGHTLHATVVGSITNVGEEYNVVTAVIIKDAQENNVTSNYAVTTVKGKLKVTPRPITITADSNKKVYDATPLTDSGYTKTPTGTGVGLVNGHVISVSVVGSITNVGSIPNEISVLSLVDEHGEDVKGNYTITCKNGVLEITARRIVVTSRDANKVYDGTALKQPLFDYTSMDGDEGLVTGQSIDVTNKGSRTDVGEAPNTVGQVTITAANGEDVTMNYQIVREAGTLTVTPRPLTTTSGDASKEYDGTALKKHEAVHSGLAPNQGVAVTYTGSATNVWDDGTNYFTVRIVDNTTQADVTSNYTVTYVYGQLTIRKRVISVATDSASKVYDGTALYKKSLQVVSETKIVSGETYKASTYATLTNVGTLANTMTIKIVKGAEDKTQNYQVIYEQYGVLEVTARPITVTAGSAEKIYDGVPLTQKATWEKQGVGFGLVDGHTLTAVNLGSLLNVGIAANEVGSVTILDKNKIDVTSNYAITRISGTLKVKPRNISVTALSAQKVYDGTPLKAPLAIETPNGDLDTLNAIVAKIGKRFTWRVTAANGEQLNVGTSSCIIADGGITFYLNNEEVPSENFVISYREGMLTVTPRPIKLVGETTTKVYDGKELVATKVLIGKGTDQGLAQGHELSVTMSGALTNVGQVPSVIESETILDALGNDVTANYEITREEGTLTVTKRPITITGGSAEKAYDGTPLTCPDVEVEAEGVDTGLVGTHTVQATTSGSITEVGVAPNPVKTVIIKNGDVDVTGNYEITKKDGTLTVLEGEEGEEGGEGGEGGENPGGSGGLPGGLDTSGGLGGGGSTPGNNSEPVVMLKFQTDADGRVYLRHKSYGDYNGKGWDPNPTAYTASTPYNTTYLMGVWLQMMGYTAVEMRVESLTQDYLLPYYAALNKGADAQTNDTMSLGDTSDIYTVRYYLYDYNGGVSMSGALTDATFTSVEEAYREFVHDNYLNVPSSALPTMQGIISEQGFSKNDADIISKVASYIKSSAAYNLNYNPALDEEEDIVVAFLTKYRQGVCRHYASAATLLFRALGIPARYTGGYVADAVSGEWVEVTSALAHAWVEVYVDGFGWVKVEVTGGGFDGGEFPGEFDPGDRDPLEISVFEVSGVYDGTQYSYEDGDWWCTNLPNGYTLLLDLEGGLVNVGQIDLKILAGQQVFTVLDEFGNDVSNEYYLVISGTPLTVTQRKLVLTVGSAQKVYDGDPLEEHSCEITVGTLVEGHYIDKIVCSGKITEAGSVKNELSEIVIRDASGNDVTSNYAISYYEGELIVLEEDA